MGECVAVVAGACLTLEYTGSASAVARSWGDKVVAYVQTWEDGAGDESWYRFLMFLLDPGYGISPCAFLVSLGSVLLLLGGVKESKNVTNFFSTLNVSLVFFMATMSLILAKRENMVPFVPPEFGVSSNQSYPHKMIKLGFLTTTIVLIPGTWNITRCHIIFLWVHWL